MKETFLRHAPDYHEVLDLESEPLVKLLQSVAYEVLHHRQRVNDAAYAVLLAHSRGSDLDHLGSLFSVHRQQVSAGNLNINPPVLPTYEDNARLRDRIQMSPEGYSTAGPIGAYIFHALSADPRVKDVCVYMPQPGVVVVAVLGTEGDGQPSVELVDIVRRALSHEDVAPLTDQISVRGADVIPFEVVARLNVLDGPETEMIRDAAARAVRNYVLQRHGLEESRDTIARSMREQADDVARVAIARSALYAALHQPGVRQVELATPASDVMALPYEAPYCTDIRVTVGDQ